ncbi:MAG: peptidylprolyl isomerase [Ponticaulis sp.]|nr:peptidylprolyl isomerase [Ponticaulis sp.]|tara:strand:- start:99827 stop:100837 length:1011 start_codon:yes stop_codon:yes gene_type:complete
MQKALATLFMGGLLAAMGACDNTSGDESGPPIRVSAAVAAVVNNEPILASEVELEAAAQGKIVPGERLDVDDPDFEEILQQLIDQKLLAQEAMTRKLNEEESAIHRLQAARERILGNILVENLVAEEVDESAIMEMYEAQVALLELGEEVLVRHILVDSESTADELYEQLRGGAEFAELAFAYSADPNSRAEGGLLGYVLPEEFPDPFPRVISRTAVGAISQPFESELGWHIVKVDDRRTEAPPTFDETRPKIVQFLTLNEISKVLARLRTRADIQTITDGDSMDVFEADADDILAPDLESESEPPLADLTPTPEAGDETATSSEAEDSDVPETEN